MSTKQFSFFSLSLYQQHIALAMRADALREPPRADGLPRLPFKASEASHGVDDRFVLWSRIDSARRANRYSPVLTETEDVFGELRYEMLREAQTFSTAGVA